jgi:hypothetical protein
MNTTKLKNYSRETKEIADKEIDVEIYLWQYATKSSYVVMYVVIFQCEEFVISVMEHMVMIRPTHLG